MLRRIPFALALATLLAACGGSDDGSTSARPVEWSGVYRSADSGPIGSITFSASKTYLLLPSGCHERACSETGTYTYDAAAKELLLEDATTHAVRTIAVEILRTSSTTVGQSLVQSVRPQGDLVNPGGSLTTGNGQKLTDGNGQKLTDDAQKLAEAGQKLLELIQQAMMNGQNMNRDNGNQGNDNQGNGNNNNNNPNKNCENPPAVNAPKADIDAFWARCPGGG